MPSKTFLNLPKEKQQNLLEAAKKEFGRTSFAMSSINRIINQAKIPRGSFYMYFKDKEDLYYYMIEEYRNKLFSLFLTNLEISKGDFIKGIENLYLEVIDYCSNNDTDFFRNILLNIRYATDKKIITPPSEEEKKALNTKILEKIDWKLYKVDKQELLEAIGLIMMITTASLVYIFMNKDNIEEEKRVYQRRLKMLKFGIYNRKETEE